ncbi:Succinate dehydrogenase cytochrome b-556 subunit [invertebrate metagenome]|uniref:Succinate dehydrogenase cytochrome b-556 subunit n=1 Tax=invertebrate metagenome TaxID=1711999 RepID=A0A484HB80_9ZZZZ
MAHKDRPLSPHIQIYRPQLTSLMSIAHRITGVALVVGTLVLTYWLGAAAYGPRAYAQAQALLGSWVGSILVFLWSGALFYHLCNGIRHLIWDMGYGLERDKVYTSGLIVLAVTAVLIVLAWGIGLSV